MMMTVESVSRLAVIAAVFCAVAVVAAPYQELAPRAGHVPVYIRVADTPLSEIHPGLAEAFHEVESASLLLEESKPNLTQEDDTRNVKPVETTHDEHITETVSNETKNNADDKEEEEVPATVVEQVKKNVESDIASFDVVKSGDTSEVKGSDKDETTKTDEAAEV